MGTCFQKIIERHGDASAGFARVLRLVRSDQWDLPTPCSEWTVRDLVNHMVRGNLNYAHLVRGGTAADFLRSRDADALGTDPVGAYETSVRECAGAFAEPGALDAVLDYPLGRAPGRQLLAVRTTDTVVHTWDLARAIRADDVLDTALVAWVDGCLQDIYAGLAETPTAEDTTNRFFAAPRAALSESSSTQDRLLYRMGRRPDRRTPST